MSCPYLVVHATEKCYKLIRRLKKVGLNESPATRYTHPYGEASYTKTKLESERLVTLLTAAIKSSSLKMPMFGDEAPGTLVDLNE